MSEVATFQIPVAQRRIVHRTRGISHGPITRLVSPSDLGQLLKPFIFLDHFELPAGGQPPQFGMHPHSGIATLTYMMSGQTGYEDTTGEQGARGVLPSGGVEWMMAGGGVWHTGAPENTERVLGFQLWVAMPPELELAEAHSIYLGPEGVPHAGPARVLLGSYGGQTSPIPAPSNMTYLGVHLKAGETWRFEPPVGHTVAWAAVGEGALAEPAALRTGDLAVFDDAGGAIEFEAQTDTAFVLGSGMQHPHELFMGPYSVHTSEAALHRGQAGIRERAQLLRQQGRL
ncbi:pirin family protein [Rhodoferax saidenbachensis]|uniref:Redox-sensitive bicupin YhaK (Pirin superfamily) n=1 Tax=Rhodoferax saidenbachensis TaxID=1484693 RepID=A0ABU1ZP22_9BURK|nr:pirin family protein [Rhodoferax saidenbachensis]MDR7307288.1 redox-sensitive bicupin YhaK (pirin superfamily) [Rhodoferax saidenbachensis]